jgi:hypothetical protein
LLADRVETSVIPAEEFRALLARIAAEFEATKPKRRRRGRGRPPMAQLDEFEDVPDFDLAEELG